ncbi:MAG: hypothetical protein HQ509_03775 [Candidatus Marinimicrobia bacterium]|nr:hypothetical protein [Candidatus Neomarinimicrobiota bacterium]
MKPWQIIIQGFILLLILGAIGCFSSTPSLKTLSETDPQYVVSHKDSILLRSDKDPEIIPMVIAAYINLSDEALEKKDYETAEAYLIKALEIDKTNIKAKYAYAMAKGHRLFKKGNKSQLWDAIEQFSKASYYRPDDGLSVYWSAKGYSKKDDSDYQNIIELYQKSIELGLPEELEADAKASLDKAKKEKEVLESFWK